MTAETTETPSKLTATETVLFNSGYRQLIPKEGMLTGKEGDRLILVAKNCPKPSKHSVIVAKAETKVIHYLLFDNVTTCPFADEQQVNLLCMGRRLRNTRKCLVMDSLIDLYNGHPDEGLPLLWEFPAPVVDIKEKDPFDTKKPVNFMMVNEYFSFWQLVWEEPASHGKLERTICI